MYRILIVDDERRERVGIENLIHRYLYPLVVYQAQDGEEALKMMEEIDIDILLTDIKMPFMTGIELIEQVHKRGYTPFCIIFSAYGEFEYAQNAISLGVIQYLLKPILLDDFQKLFDKVCGLCEEKYKRIEENRHIQEEKKNQKMLESFRSFLLYLEEGFYSDGEKQEMEELFLQQEHRPLLISSYSFLFSLRWKEYKDDLKRITGSETIIVNMEDTQILLLIPEEQEERDILVRRYCEEIIEVSKNTYQIDVFITAGKKCGSLDEMKREYEKIRELIDYQFFISESSYVLCDKDYIGRKQSDMLSIYFSKIVTCAKLKDYAGIKKEFEKAFLYIDKNKGFSSIYVKYNFSDIIRKVCECLKTEEHLVDVVEKIYATRSMEEMKMVILQFAGQLEMQETEVPDNRLVFLAKQIVSEKYQDISLGVSMIADELHVSLPYLSTLFKMETGQTLVKYVTSYRMEQARLLLENSNMKIADVAERVGYLNTSYFISLFRNREGCSPQQYREKKFNHEEA